MSDVNTRLWLIETAERLFAERGIDNVSLREINRAAGQKNVAALHYHFGTRESLLEAMQVSQASTANNTKVSTGALKRYHNLTQVGGPHALH